LMRRSHAPHTHMHTQPSLAQDAQLCSVKARCKGKAWPGETGNSQVARPGT